MSVVDSDLSAAMLRSFQDRSNRQVCCSTEWRGSFRNWENLQNAEGRFSPLRVLNTGALVLTRSNGRFARRFDSGGESIASPFSPE